MSVSVVQTLHSLLQVECKKAQPKEVMMPQAQKNTRLNQAILVPGGPTPAFG